ncbi:MAG: iron-containing alcohol dehydrogenase family protein [Clostridia bacterium]|jgi:glycerol dehydrogenase|nr:iron-containing alcohol dehydrogenase family protein [Clostridia bacterium]
MSETTVTFAGYTIGYGKETYKELGPICSRYGKKAVVIGGERALAAAKPYITEAVKGTGIEITGFEWFGGVASYENAERLGKIDSVKNADMIFACGGGKAIDTSKCVARNLDKPFFTFPTIAATCASITAIAVMYYPNGVQKDVFVGKRPAIHAFINLNIIAQAPPIYLWAGIGDTLAKYTEVPFSSRGHEHEMAHKDALPLCMSRMTGEPLLQYGKEAYDLVKQGKTSFALEQTVLAITVTSGMVSYLIDAYKYNSSMGHAIFYGMTVIPQIEEKHLHGEVVSYGVLCMLMMDKQMDLLDKIYKFMKSIGLPTKLADMDVKIEEMGPAIESAATKYDIEFAPYKITKELMMQAVKDLEEYNKTH